MAAVGSGMLRGSVEQLDRPLLCVYTVQPVCRGMLVGMLLSAVEQRPNKTRTGDGHRRHTESWGGYAGCTDSMRAALPLVSALACLNTSQNHADGIGYHPDMP